MAKKKLKNFEDFDFYGEKIERLSGDSYKEYFDNQLKTDKWHSVGISELVAYGLEDNMLTVSENEEHGTTTCETRVVDYFTEKIRKKDVEVNASVADIERCINSDTATRRVLEFPTDTKILRYPVARTAREGLYGRTGTGSTRVDNSLGDDDKFLEFNPYARASMINEHARTFKNGEVTILVRDNRLLAVHSDNYSILPMKHLIEETENVLATRYGTDWNFSNGQTSNSFTKVLYYIGDAKIVEEVKKVFKNTNYAGHEVGMLFTSSDTGTNCATACCVLFKGDDYLIISKEHKLKHTGKAVCEDFKLEVEKCFSSATEIMDTLKKMSNESVYHLPDFVRHVGAVIGLGKKETCDYARNLPKDGTQFDAYMAICDIISLGLQQFPHSPEMTFKMNEMANE
ncbi:MAG: hypothetical protein IK121_03480, partial [Lachnospiraceae bacterium]|nr:hypothetical protein [Lachnospiraceae bacterium]